MPRILAIETSCDETAAAVVEGESIDDIHVRSNTLASQAALHARYGGVFPDLAAREHAKRIVPVIGLSLHEAGLLDDPEARGQAVQQALAAIDAIAVTVGPGLIGPLLIGTAAASQLANLTRKPIIPVNHWEGHIYSAFLSGAGIPKPPTFPLLVLTVSGGHTSLILMTDHFQYQMLGSTVDDAAGEAFDKTARLLGLGYPGGAALSKAAAEARANGHTIAVKLPRPMLHSGDLRFSFSGLKTAVRYAIDRGEITVPADVPAAAAAIEDAIVDVLLAKLELAIKQTQPASVAIVGGVSANEELRRRFLELTSHYPRVTHHLPEGPYCTDNAAMIGTAGVYRLLVHPAGLSHILTRPDRSPRGRRGKNVGVFAWQDLHANASLRLG